MRCADLTGTWSELKQWLAARDVLVLPRLTGNLPMVRLDGDLPPDRPASAADVVRVIERLHQVVDRFRVPAVYVGQVFGESATDPSGITVRVVAGGVLHELPLTAAWSVAYDLDVAQSLAPAVG